MDFSTVIRNACFYPLSRRRGFTLIEILIIAALISLFSGLAIFSMQYLVESSKKKAAIADARTIGSVLSATHIDLGLFPKIGYLSYPKAQLELFTTTAGVDTTDDSLLPPYFDTMGFKAPNTRSEFIMNHWIGPYLPNPRSRTTASPSAGGYSVRAGVGPGNSVVVDWPADAWGNPYVVYLVHIEGAERGNTIRWIRHRTEEPNFVAAVVSYGKNGVPGCLDNVDRNSPIAQAARQYQLFTTNPMGSEAEYTMFAESDFNQNRWLALHNGEGWSRATNHAADAAFQFLSAYPEQPGIMDPGSDDIVYMIP